MSRVYVMPPQDPDQRTKALASAARRKRELAQFKSDLRAGRITLTDVLTDPPECVRERSLFEILLLTPGVGDCALALLNEKAIGERINLALPVGSSSMRARRWIIDHQPGRWSRSSLARRRGQQA